MHQQGVPPAPLPVSLKDGRYQLLELLGAGSQKRVYRARDRSLGRDVAISLIDSVREEEERSRLTREASAAGRLSAHPNIVTIHDVSGEGEQPYIVTEYMPGGDLAAMLAEADAHRLPWQRAAHITEEICRALEHAHVLDVIHRDVKPENIWFSAEGTPKLGDFGLALVRDLSRLSSEGTFVGTLAYLAPEQAFGGPAEPRSDLYSVGAVLYEMTTGRPPFLAEDASSVLSQQINVPALAPSALNPEIPPVLDELILELLAKLPEDRPASAALVAGRLAAIRATAMGETPRDSSPIRGDPLTLGGFVARREELGQLRSAFDEALSGKTGLRVLAGEAGIGKSRTAAELEAYARLRGASVFHGRCYEGRGAPAFWPWVQLLREYTAERGSQARTAQLGSQAGVIDQVVRTVLEELPSSELPPASDPDQARFRFFDSVAELIRRAATERPLVLVLDDIQWADASSLMLLEFLAHDLRDARALILAAYRTEEIERSDQAARTLTRLRRESICDRIALGGMSEPEVGELLVCLGGRRVSPDFVRFIHRQTEGNPFFIGEMLRHLVDEGVIQREAGGWVGEEACTDIGVPEGVRDLISRRLSRLGERCRQILTLAAVIGRDFGLDAVAEGSHCSRAEISEILEEAVDARLLLMVRGRADQYGFSHTLIRETLYEDLRPLRRARLHRQIGEALERLYAQELEAHVAELAHHFFEAMHDGDVGKAMDYAARAGERANRRLAYEEAARQFGQALEALALRRPRDHARECQLLLARGATLWSAGETHTARETFLRAAEVARQAGDPLLLAEAALGAGGRYPGLQIGILDERLVALLEEALSALKGSDAPPVPEIMARLAEALSHADDAERRQSLARTAIATARRRGDPLALARVLQHVHLPLWTPENVEERLAMSGEMLALAEQTGATDVSLAARGWQLVHLLEIGEIEAVHREVEEYGRLADELRQPVYQYVAHLRKTVCVLLEGRFDEAESLASRTVPLGQRAQVATAVQAFGAQTFSIRLAQGRLAELEPGVAALVEQYPAVPVWRIGLALIYSETGRFPDARRALERLAEKQFEDLPRDLNFFCGLALLAFVAADLRDARRAGLLYELLLPQATRCILAAGSAPLGSASLFLGILAATLERWEEAAAHFERAFEMNTRIGARPWLAHTAQRYAQMLMGRGLPGDARKVVDLLDRAQPIAEELGMGSLNQRIRTLRTRLDEPEGGGGSRE